MPTASDSPIEVSRRHTLKRYDLNNGPAEPFFDSIVEMTASMFRAPIALVTIVDSDVAWFKARKGIELPRIRREDSFCDHVVRQANVFVVEDTLVDDRFRTKPQVIGEPFIRFYAAAPIVTSNGLGIGTVCVMDTKARGRPSARNLSMLQHMANLVMQQIEARSLESVKRGALELTRTTPDGVVVINAAREILFWNRSAERILGFSRRQIVGETVDLILPDLEGDRLNKAVEWSRKVPFECESRMPDGSRRPIEFCATPWTDNGRSYVGFVIRDVTERKSFQRGLEDARTIAEHQKLKIEDNRRFVDAVIENLPSVVLAKDSAQRYVLVNSAAEKFFEMRRDDMLGRRAEELFPPSKAVSIAAEDAHVLTLEDGGLVEEDYVHSSLKGDRILKTKKLVISSESGREKQILVLGEDVTEERAAVARISYMAHHDPLTSLANRTALSDQVATALKTIGKSEAFALLYLDLDNFKSVNDTLGHIAGDRVLMTCARRMCSLVPKDATLARLGGDEFAILLRGPEVEPAAREIAQSLRLALSEPIAVDGNIVTVGTSIGIVIAPRHAASPEELLRCGDVALYEAKRAGRGTVCVFNPELDQAARARHTLGNDLRRALADEQFELHYQPVYTTRGGDLDGYEALIRWRHPERGMVSPGDFIPIAEETGLIHAMGEWVLQTACKEAATWPEDLQVAVNLSPVQFKRRSLPLLVGSCLSHSGLSPSRLELEVTESVMLDETFSNLAILKQLQALGVKIALDDFGVGYSSLSYLRSFPFAKLKIDRSFVKEMGTSKEARAIVRAITTLGRSLSMITTAEGVETQQQFEAVKLERCDLVQGYLRGKPMPAADLPHKALLLRSGCAPKLG